MPLVIPQAIPAPSIAAIWAYATRTLTDPDSYKADVSALALEATLNAVGVAVLTRAPAGEYNTQMARITLARALLIDSLGTPANFMADISGLPTAAQIWAYATRMLTQLSRVQEGTQATTNALAVIGAAIEHATIPFIVEGCLSLHNMQAGDEFLVIEEVRDEDDATYRSYGRNTFSGVQTDPLIQFEPKRCQGWRVRIQRTAGADRNVTFQFSVDQGGA